jgi:hypothetical protein
VIINKFSALVRHPRWYSLALIASEPPASGEFHLYSMILSKAGFISNSYTVLSATSALAISGGGGESPVREQPGSRLQDLRLASRDPAFVAGKLLISHCLFPKRVN